MSTADREFDIQAERFRRAYRQTFPDGAIVMFYERAEGRTWGGKFFGDPYSQVDICLRHIGKILRSGMLTKDEVEDVEKAAQMIIGLADEAIDAEDYADER